MDNLGGRPVQLQGSRLYSYVHDMVLYTLLYICFFFFHGFEFLCGTCDICLSLSLSLSLCVCVCVCLACVLSCVLSTCV
jgi:hypothetical protein